MASLGTLAAGLMHELNNPGAAASRAASQLRENLMRMHELTAKFSKTEMSTEQKQCMFELQEQALSEREASGDDELAGTERRGGGAGGVDGGAQHRERMEAGADAGFDRDLIANELECARSEFPGADLLGCAELAGGDGLEHAAGGHDRREHRPGLRPGEGGQVVRVRGQEARSRTSM